VTRVTNRWLFWRSSWGKDVKEYEKYWSSNKLTNKQQHRSMRWHNRAEQDLSAANTPSEPLLYALKIICSQNAAARKNFSPIGNWSPVVLRPVATDFTAWTVRDTAVLNCMIILSGRPDLFHAFSDLDTTQCALRFVLNLLNPLKLSGNYMYHLLQQSVTLRFVFVCFVWFSL
jgi:hypothetical protein